LGGTENTLGITDKLVRLQGATTSLYRRPGEAGVVPQTTGGKAVA